MTGDQRNDAGDIVGGVASAGLSAIVTSLLFPDSAGGSSEVFQGTKSTTGAVRSLMQQAVKKFGVKGAESQAGEQWMWNQLGHRVKGQGSKTPSPGTSPSAL